MSFREGTVGDTFYILASGEVTVTRSGGETIRELSTGDYFGEQVGPCLIHYWFLDISSAHLLLAMAHVSLSAIFLSRVLCLSVSYKYDCKMDKYV